MKKILICDSSHAYLAYLKRKFKTNYEITNYSKTDRKQLNLDSYEAVIFIINTEIELLELMYIYTFVNNIFVSTNCKELNKRLSEIQNITVLNLNKSKNQLVEQIQFWLDDFESIKQNHPFLQPKIYA